MTTTSQATLGALFDPANRPDPYPLFAALREAGPFAVMDGALVVIGDYAECARLLRDPSLSSDRGRSRMVPTLRRRDDGVRPTSFLSMDPPDHTRLRRLVAKAFTPRVIAGLEPRIRQIVDEQLAATGGSIDVVAELAYPLPVRIISELLGVPHSDHVRLEDWSRRLVRGLDPAMAVADEQEAAAIIAASEEFAEYFTALIAARRREPGDDLLSRLVRIEEEGDQLSEAELVGTCVLLLVAGHETTANLIANGVLALLRNPGALAAVRTDPAGVGRVVEEVLRHDPPVQLTTRITREPVTIGQVRVEPDSVLLLLLGAANRDPHRFADPDRFDPARTDGQHLAFAAGPHFCLGAGLARLEASIALSAFAHRLVDPVLDTDSLSYRPHVNLRGPQRLVVDFRRIAA